MTLHKPIEKIASNRLIVDLICAFAASQCAGAFKFLIYLQKPREFEILTYCKFMLTAIVAYFTVALILHKVWVGGLRRMLPSWILISVFGSVIFVIIRLLPAVISGWSGPTVTQPSLSEYIAMEVAAARSGIIVLSFITLPVTALFYYANSIIGAVKHWHDGTESPLSIHIAPSLKK